MDVHAVSDHYVAKLQLCFRRTTNSLSLARTVHAHMMISGFKPHKFIFNLLISVYCKTSNMVYARQVFDKITDPDIVSRTALVSAYSAAGDLKQAWEIFGRTPIRKRDSVFYNAMITGCLKNKDGLDAVALFRDMRRDGVRPDSLTFMGALNALAMIVGDERECTQIHCAVVKSGTGFATKVSNALVSVYVKCAYNFLSTSSMAAARKLFDEMPERDEITWATMVTGYSRSGDFDAARELLGLMTNNFASPWNAMISGCVHGGCFEEALRVFVEMYLKGISQDEFTYTSALSACANGGFFQHGRQLHAHILRTKERTTPKFSLFVSNALVTLYYRFSRVDEARKIFDRMALRDSVSWTAILSSYVDAKRMEEAKSFFGEIPEKNLRTWTVMISGLAQNGLGEEAIKLFNQMRSEGAKPCEFVFSGAITSCAVLGALNTGRQLHSLAIRSGNDSGLSVGNALITMYARCGVVEAAERAFLTTSYLDPVSWNAMIAALAQHGKGTQAIELFEKMLKEDIQPTKITFLTVLSACSHAGLIEEGRKYFESMFSGHGIVPDEEHYAGMIDLLCRAGEFAEAKDVINSMPFDPGSRAWESILAGSWNHGHMDLCIQAAEKLFQLTPEQDMTYIILSNMYASIGKWEEVGRVRESMRGRGVKKEPGCSWIEVENKVHVFLVDDYDHAEAEAVHEYLNELVTEMKKLGYVADTKHVLRDVECEHKEQAVSTHSEKLAVAFGLMKLPPGAAIRVFKNLRICGDCHNAIKLISRLVDREIVVRDGRRFHHFKNGDCSCGNYW